MKNKIFVTLGGVFTIILVFVIYGNKINTKPIEQNPANSNKQNSETLQKVGKAVEITFEEAFKMKMLYGDMPQEIAQEVLIKEENRILEEITQVRKDTSDKTIEEIKPRDVIKYYFFMEEFAYSENTDFSVYIEAVIVVVDTTEEDEYIDRVDYISTKIAKGEDKAQWVQTASSNNIETNKISVRLSATGYFSVSKENSSQKQIIGFENPSTGKGNGILYSKTIYPTFNFALKDAK